MSLSAMDNVINTTQIIIACISNVLFCLLNTVGDLVTLLRGANNFDFKHKPKITHEHCTARLPNLLQKLHPGLHEKISRSFSIYYKRCVLLLFLFFYPHRNKLGAIL